MLPSGDLPQIWYYKRPNLAASVLERASRMGRIALFGPRQTGKTSLLTEEVMPLAANNGYLPIYIECWKDRTNVVGTMLYALQQAIDDLSVPAKGVARTATTPVRKLGFASASIELGDSPKRTMPDSKYLQFDALLATLLREIKRPVLLIFDEFQVLSQASDAEIAAASIRAALTEKSKRVNVVFSGSSQVELMRMFSRAKAPLYGFADPEPYPLLDRAFVEHVHRKFKAACGRSFDVDEATNLLALFGSQPEAFLTAIGYLLASPAMTLAKASRAMLEPRRQNRWSINWMTLSASEKAALLLVFDGRQVTARESLEWAAERLSKPKLAPTTLVRALASLTEQGFIERDLLGGERAKYQLVDPVMQAWLQSNRAAI